MGPYMLNPGDVYHLAFVTEGTRRPTSTDILEYDAFVQAEADAGSVTAPMGLTWKALGSTAAVNAIDHVPISGPVFLVDLATKIADDQADLWDGSIDAPLNITPNGNTADTFPGTQPWTGTRFNGQRFPFAELGSGLEVAYGSTFAVNSGWVFVGQLTEKNSRPFYAISEPIKIPENVPEPTSIPVLICIAGIGLFRANRRR